MHSTLPIVDIRNVSFIVNTKKCGKGSVKCKATYSDGNEAVVIHEKLEEYIFRVKIIPTKTGPMHLHVCHVPPAASPSHRYRL
ncbi:hypothetical protein BpHYR1_053009 [Brachionus plicatilis]|uniref:Uncharacterized protein n=1 Tax=Brachionus plicatilis TaxID=10195 RepID=A0A3M7SA34_BRAPC|nr:hypothetical protein BpHYR1_053009 [Brachionus plicatilis]